MLKKFNFLYLTCIITCVFVALLVIFPDIAAEYARNGIILWYKSILPTMLPFLIAAIFATKIGIADFLAEIFSRVFEKLLKISGYGAFAIICAAISGYPMGAKIVSELIISKKISLNEGKKILVASGITSPAFIIGSVASDMFGNKKAGVLILICHYLSAFILCAQIKTAKPKMSAQERKSFCSYVKKINLTYQSQNKTLPDLFSESIASASQTLISICCFIVIFSIAAGFLSNSGIMPSLILGENFKILDGVFISIIEMTNGCNLLSLEPANINISAACAMISFGGLCIHFQILSVLSNTGIKPAFVFITKALHCALSFVLSYIFIAFIFKF